MRSIHLLKLSRLEGLTDGIFAIAMTILILDVRIPLHISGDNLIEILKNDILIKLLIFIGSFIILGTLWVAMIFQLSLLERLNRPYLWTNIFYLMVICIVPFSASLLAAFPNSPISIDCYAINLLFASMGQLLIAECAHFFKLNQKIKADRIRTAVIKRILVAPIFYIASFITAQWSVSWAFILLIAPTLLYIFPGKIDTYEETKM